jgi:hypothetical protein
MITHRESDPALMWEGGSKDSAVGKSAKAAVRNTLSAGLHLRQWVWCVTFRLKVHENAQKTGQLLLSR